MTAKRWFFLSVALLVVGSPWPTSAAERDVFDRDNLTAWCIVPFDAAQRGPEERARMLQQLGIRQLAYDWRAEHVPQFDEEVEAMQRHGVRISAWWIAPPDLNETNRKILDVVRRHGLKLQFWVLNWSPTLRPPTRRRPTKCASRQRRFVLWPMKLLVLAVRSGFTITEVGSANRKTNSRSWISLSCQTWELSTTCIMAMRISNNSPRSWRRSNPICTRSI